MIALTWHLRTREMDFMTPGQLVLLPEDMGEELIEESAVLQPKIEGPSIHELLGRPEPTPSPDDTLTPEVPEISDEELGDLESAPGLDTYRDFAQSNDAARLLQLSSTLRARGQFQRALLAFERVIDSAASHPVELEDAGKGIKALSPTLEWNIDPNFKIPLILRIGTETKSSEALKTAALEVATLIRDASGDLLEVTPLISSGDAKNSSGEIRTSLGTSGDNPSSTMEVTVAGSEDSKAMTESLALAVFSAVRIHLTGLNFPEPHGLEGSGTDFLTQQITRLMWRDLASSLGASRTSPLPEEVLESDDQN